MKLYKLFATVLLVALLAIAIAPAQLHAAAAACDAAQFVADVSIPDGTSLSAGAAFNKTWRLKNVGTCTWTTDYSVVFVSGDQLGAPTSVKLPTSTAPGQTVDVSVAMTAPANAGTYRGYWQLKNASGTQFGIGSSANKSFWVEIKVASVVTSAGYDFVANAASAAWSSAAGTLTFPGAEGNANGLALKLDAPKLETGVTDSLPGLLLVPQNATNGYIQGQYPAYRVAKGDRFEATVGCEYGATACYVNLRLDYQIGTAAPQTLWSFNEKYEGQVYRASINLDGLAGQDVKFILRTSAAGSAAGDRSVWGAARLTRSGVTITATPITATVTPGTATLTPTPNASCDKATFVADVTIPDGTILNPNTAFVKTWRLKNVGTCTWSTAYSAVYQSGEKMGTTEAVAFARSVAPGQTIDITVNMISPVNAGTYRGYWILKNASGQLFGIGSGANKPFWVEIKVVSGATATPGTPTATAIIPTPVPGAGAYDFVANACSAQWVSGAGVLPCPGANGDAKGFALIASAPRLETGATDTRPGLLTVPQAGTSTYIQGIYPAFRVETGDRFQATIGCEYGASECYVGFRLDYQIGSQPTQNFWTFNERYEGYVYNADLDLSALAGKDVKFILTILSNGSASGDRAQWVAPRIVRTSVSATATAIVVVPTSTSTSLPSATPSATVPSPTATFTSTSTLTLTPPAATATPSAMATETPSPTFTSTP